MIKNESKDLKSKVSFPYPFDLEIKRYGGGLKMVVVGAIGISELSDSSIVIKCHGIRMNVLGTKLKINVLESKTLEIYGRTEEIKFTYGKN